jgi:hypothetical protein
MNAIVSGRSGRALLIEGDSLKSFEVDDPSTLTSRQQADLPFLFGEALDLRILENTTIEDVTLELKNDCNFTWALDLTLISLDAELSNKIRREAINSLEKLLDTKETLIQVEQILFAHPLPEGADLTGILKLCSSAASSVVRKLRSDLEGYQPKISEVCHAWELIPTKFFGSYENRDALRSSAVSDGLFRAMVKEPPGSYLFSVQAAFSVASNNFPNHGAVLHEWYKLCHTRQRGYPSVRESQAQEIYEGKITPEVIQKALRRARGNQVRAARLLGITPKDLRKLLSNPDRPRLTM